MDEIDESLNLAWQFLDRHLEAGHEGKSHENEAISGFPVPGRGRAGPLRGPLESFGMERMKKMVPTEVVVFMLAGSREGKMEIPESKVNELGPKEDCEEQNAIPARR